MTDTPAHRHARDAAADIAYPDSGTSVWPPSYLNVARLHTITSDIRDAEWRQHAACKGKGPDLFFPHEELENGEIRYLNPTPEARALCAACPVAEECAQYAVDTNQTHGLWGGLTVRQRRLITPRRSNAGAPRKPIAHGTVSGYYTHQRREIPPCDECKRAAAAHAAQYKQTRRGTA